MAALPTGQSVLFYSAADLLEQLANDRRADCVAQRLQALCRPHILVLDEIGYFSLDKQAAQFLLRLRLVLPLTPISLPLLLVLATPAIR